MIDFSSDMAKEAACRKIKKVCMRVEEMMNRSVEADWSINRFTQVFSFSVWIKNRTPHSSTKDTSFVLEFSSRYFEEGEDLSPVINSLVQKAIKQFGFKGHYTTFLRGQIRKIAQDVQSKLPMPSGFWFSLDDTDNTYKIRFQIKLDGKTSEYIGTGTEESIRIASGDESFRKDLVDSIYKKIMREINERNAQKSNSLYMTCSSLCAKIDQKIRFLCSVSYDIDFCRMRVKFTVRPLLTTFKSPFSQDVTTDCLKSLESERDFENLSKIIAESATEHFEKEKEEPEYGGALQSELEYKKSRLVSIENYLSLMIREGKPIPEDVIKERNSLLLWLESARKADAPNIKFRPFENLCREAASFPKKDYLGEWKA